jgi:hypothetical protein
MCHPPTFLHRSREVAATIVLCSAFFLLAALAGDVQGPGRPRQGVLVNWSDRVTTRVRDFDSIRNAAVPHAGHRTQRRHATLAVSRSPRAQTASSSFAKLGRPFVINLERRTDRMASFMETAAHVGITNVTVVRGVPHECGLLGLTLAHITALQICWASSWVDSCLIMEDDFAVRLPPDNATALIDSFLQDVPTWDVLMLSCNLQLYMHEFLPGRACPPYAVRVVKGMSAAGYAVRRAYAPNITSTLIEAITRLRADCSIQFANDVSWIDLQRSDLWFTLHHADMRRGIIGYQAPSYSDVQHVHTG